MPLTPRQQVAVRRDVSYDLAPRWTKAEIGDIFQAIEDWWTSPAVRSNLSSRIDTASGVGLTNAEKRVIIKHWLNSRFGRE